MLADEGKPQKTQKRSTNNAEKELEKLLDNLAEVTGAIGLMVWLEQIPMEHAQILIDGMIMLAIKEHGMSEKLAVKVSETLKNELADCVAELEEL